jgi:acetylornithine deacetylase/succinyl-diaminopimelate desuccinylase-like protein
MEFKVQKTKDYYVVLIMSIFLLGAFDGVGCKTVIPRHVVGKFSIRIVPNMKIATVEQLVEKHVQHIMKDRNSPNKVTVKLEHGGDYWVADPNDPQYIAARKATVAVHGIEPDLTREGGSIPITCKFDFFVIKIKYSFS